MPLRFLQGPNINAALREAATLANDDARAAAIAGTIETLGAMTKRARVRAARKLDLKAIVADLGRDAVPLLRVLLDDDAVRDAIGDAVAAQWLALDAPGCVEHALARLDEWEPTIGLRVLVHLDASEAFEVLAPRIEGDRGLRRFIVDSGGDIVAKGSRLFDDPRWPDVAMHLLSHDHEAGIELLRLNGSARADEELDGILERAVAVDDVVICTLEALEAGSNGLGRSGRSGRRDASATRQRFFDALLRFLSSPAAEGIESTRIAFSISIAAHDLLPLAHVQGRRVAVERSTACRHMHPVQVRG